MFPVFPFFPCYQFWEKELSLTYILRVFVFSKVVQLFNVFTSLSFSEKSTAKLHKDKPKCDPPFTEQVWKPALCKHF